MLKGIIYAVAAYVSWGLLAIYWKALETVPALQILGHRIAWSFVILWLILMVSGRWITFLGMIKQPRLVIYHLAGAILIGINWLTYIWGVNAGWILNTLLIGGGLMTILPLICFAAATRRIPLSLVGILQYIAPTLQFLVGILIYHEPVPQDRLWGFILVWIALLIFVVEGLWAKIRRDRLTGDVAR